MPLLAFNYFHIKYSTVFVRILHSSGLIARKRHTKRDDSVIHYHPFIAGKVYILTSRLSTN